MTGTALLLLAQLSIVASAPERASTCEPITVTVRTRVPGPESPRIVLPDFSPFVLTRSSATPRLTADANGRMWAIDEFQYTIASARPGRYVIPPFEARLRGQSRRSKPLAIRVLAVEADDSVPSIIGSALLRGPGPVHFEALVSPDTVYVGEQATYQAAAFVEDSLQTRLRRNPEFFPPEMRSMLTYEMPFVRGYLPRASARNECFEVPVFQRAIFPLTAGRHVIPPAQLVFALPRAFNFFSREESRELYTDTLLLIALEPPAVGQPDDYAGAVGSLSVDARLDTRGRVGDPLTLTVAVTGTANVKFLPRPVVAVPWATLVPAAERVEVAPSRQVRGTKEFDWVLTPRAAGTMEVPPVRYPYFDPTRESYEIALTAPLRVDISPGALAAPIITPRDSAMLALRRTFRGELPLPAHTRPVFWAVLLIAPLPALALGAVRRPRRRPPKRTANHVLRSLASGRTRADARTVRRAYVLAIADRLRLNAELLSRRGALASALRRAGVTADVAVRAESLLRTLDEGAFAPEGSLAPGAARRALAVYRDIDREARSRDAIDARQAVRSRRTTTLVALGFAAGGASLAAANVPGVAERLFAHGVAAYDAADFAEASRVFATLARSAPRAPDAWANLGTSAWANGDTAMATVGWQRALRLEPLSDEIRGRLTAVHGEGPRDLGRVPLVPVEPLALGAALCWVVACALALLAVARRTDGPRSGARVAGLLAIVIAAAAARVEAQTGAEDLAVVSAEHPLRALPALSAERVGVAIAGEIVRTLEQHGQWTRVARSDGRSGWTESRRLISLDER